MKNVNTIGLSKKGGYAALNITQQMQHARHVQEPFSDSDILDLQDAFLNNGLHYIKVDDTQSGRSLIRLFLRSLNFYHNIASLTVASDSLFDGVTDLYSELILGGYLDLESSHEFEEFFLEKFYYDFMWIETSKELLKKTWAKKILKTITQLKLDQMIPVLVVTYKE